MIAAHEQTVAQAYPLLGSERRTLIGLPVGDDVRAQVAPAVDRRPPPLLELTPDRRLDPGVGDAGQAAATRAAPSGAYSGATLLITATLSAVHSRCRRGRSVGSRSAVDRRRTTRRSPAVIRPGRGPAAATPPAPRWRPRCDRRR